jgi:hypothetical protein
MSANRRQILVAAGATLLSLPSLPVSAQTKDAGGTFTYRGFTVDVTGAAGQPNLPAIESSLKHQIDITADCGASAATMTFFKSQEIFVVPGEGDGGGHFSANSKGVSVDPAVEAPEKPVVLHELLHAYHYRVLPNAFENTDVLRFYNRAKENALYPEDSYVMRNVREFFAVTASLYLWGNVDRPPHTRANLHDMQPIYYKWLGDLFGVQKSV